MSTQRKDDYDWAYGPISPQSPPLTPSAAAPPQYSSPYQAYPQAQIQQHYPQTATHGHSLSLNVPPTMTAFPHTPSPGAWTPYTAAPGYSPSYFPQQQVPDANTNPYFANANMGAGMGMHARSVSAYQVPTQQQQQQTAYTYTPQQPRSTNPFFGSPAPVTEDIPVPMSAPPVMSGNPFTEPITATPTVKQQPNSGSSSNSGKDEDEGEEAQQTELPNDLELKGNEKSMDSYEALDVYWDQQFSAVLTPADANSRMRAADKEKKKEKDRYEKKRPEYFFESKPFSSQKSINNAGDVTLYACGRGTSSPTTTATSPAVSSLKDALATAGDKKKEKKNSSAYDGKGTVVGCVRYHHANWKGHWRMHVCMGNPSLESARYECMTQCGVVKDRQWLLEGFKFTYTTTNPSSTKTCGKFRLTTTKSAIPDDVEAYTKYGNMKLQDAESNTTVAVYLHHGVSLHKRGRILLRKGLSDEFRDFAVLCLLGVDERRQRDYRNSSYCASGWWVHMAARGIAGDRMKKAKEAM